MLDWTKLKSGSDVRGTALGENAVLFKVTNLVMKTYIQKKSQGFLRKTGKHNAPP